MTTGKDLLKEAEHHIGEEYVYGADVPLEQGDDYHGPTDCAEFATEVVHEKTGKIYGALRPDSDNPEPWTGEWFRQVLEGEVFRVSVEQAVKTPGALLLRFDRQVKHIVFSDGKGGTVEAMGRAYGVCRGRVTGRGFKYGILIPGVVYKEVV
jgi:hypothetical protein